MATVTKRGPWFDGRADAAIRAFLDAAEQEVAQQGVNDVQAATGIFRNPTGRYRDSVQTERQVGDWAVTDGGIVYGPWLEGVGSRNQTTRFKGYAIFRRTTRTLQGKAHRIAERVLDRYIGRMQ